MSRRTKIVCTLGPAVRTPEKIRALVEAGMDVARLNFSHGSHAEHAELCAHVRRASEETGRAVAVLGDLQGPKIRLGRFAAGGAMLDAGAEFVVTTAPVLGSAHLASTNYEGLPRDVRPGATLLVDDGAVRLQVIAVEGETVRTRVVEGGRVSDHKGLNLPGVRVSVPTLTPKDLEDLEFASTLPVDLIALSFVRSPADAGDVRRALGSRSLPVIAKIERPEAVERLDQIVEAFDGIMVARGDLGVELPLVDVPLVQKRAIEAARARAKAVIVATQMLESMIVRTRPTRAEVSDVANAVLDGTDAVMLSGETSIGAHPLEAATTMSEIVSVTETDGAARIARLAAPGSEPDDAIAAAATALARDLGARAVVAFTRTGKTARRLARHHAPIPLLVFTTDPAVRNRLALVWGVEAFVVQPAGDTEDMIRQVDRALIDLGRGATGDWVVIVAGTPDLEGTTHTIRVHRLGAS